MSVALYLVLEKAIPGSEAVSICGKVLEKIQAQLDGIAKQQGLTPLRDFISVGPDEAAAFFGEDGIPDGLHPPAEEWFDAADGLRSVQGLLALIRHDPARIRNVQVERVLRDLEAAEEILFAACKQGIRFHVAIDF